MGRGERPVSVRQVAALYTYDNGLYAIEGTGKMVRDALENAAPYFKTGGGFNPVVYGFNYDIAKGVEYEIDLTQAEGHRIRNLRWHSAALRDDQKLRLAVNNYREGGSAGLHDVPGREDGLTVAPGDSRPDGGVLHGAQTTALEDGWQLADRAIDGEGSVAERGARRAPETNQ